MRLAVVSYPTSLLRNRRIDSRKTLQQVPGSRHRGVVRCAAMVVMAREGMWRIVCVSPWVPSPEKGQRGRWVRFSRARRPADTSETGRDESVANGEVWGGRAGIVNATDSWRDGVEVRAMSWPGPL